ncbi:YdeI/OmpD-associated family protein [Williamsia sp. CHRR-6]|uniref:YdeI/OmpD-associated family protein n=1 Tax=Williamsia sp. CHRR-6 TaxID=2835871 RepID=UPI001BDB1F24|nr:YdeI/OmpD-associated family protein [Williamsia sp. CHRR-6]MBT0566228.1 YdeI/OmpD-associated family protein [Williamsia sp. CHRR-6]
MSAWFEFDAPLELLPWKAHTYPILRLPGDLVAAAKVEKTRRIEGTIDGVEVNLGINRTDVTPDSFIYLGRGQQRRLQVEVGELLSCRLRPVDPDIVPVPQDVADALATAGRTAAFERIRPAQRRRMIKPIIDAVRDDTRATRISALIAALDDR